MILVFAIMCHFENSPCKKESFILVLQNLKIFKIAHEQDFLMTYHHFFDVTDAD
jgi:hypothetical protein